MMLEEQGGGSRPGPTRLDGIDDNQRHRIRRNLQHYTEQLRLELIQRLDPRSVRCGGFSFGFGPIGGLDGAKARE